MVLVLILNGVCVCIHICVEKKAKDINEIAYLREEFQVVLFCSFSHSEFSAVL